MSKNDYVPQSLFPDIADPDKFHQTYSLDPGALQFVDRKTVDETVDIKLVPFKSQVAIPEYFGRYRNMHYHLRFYLPKKKKAKSKFSDLYIMFNGLAEAAPAFPEEL